MANGDTKTNQYLDIAANGSRADLPADSCCDTRTQSLIRGVAERIMDVEDEVEELKNNPDVVDIVATYADLGDYDTSGLTDKDVIRVLQDETHNDDSTYYRWDATAQEWSYIGESKQYTDFVGTDGTAAGEAGLVPAPATTDAGKFLKADGTWDTAGSTINVVQTTGTSTTDVMSQNAVTDMIAPRNSNDALWINNPKGTNVLPATLSNYSVTINPTTSGTGGAGATATSAIAINGTASGHSAVAIGINTKATQRGSIALGRGASATSVGEMNIGTNDTTAGYNSTNYRLLSGVHDPVNAHDAATKGYVDSQAGGPTVVQTTGTSTTDVMSQNAVTSMVYTDPSTMAKIRIGGGTVGSATAPVVIGRAASVRGNYAVAIGSQAGSQALNAPGAISLGAFSNAGGQGQMDISLASATPQTRAECGYNGSEYRLLTGLYDPQSAHDAATKGYVDGLVGNVASALNIINNGTGA